MTYGLAKKLKDAGFPYTNGEGMWWIVDMDKWKLINTRELNFVAKQVTEKKSRKMPEHYRVPTLSELIEACGKDFKNLTHEMGTWYCNYSYTSDGQDENFGADSEGRTPEAAVAKLWLALHN